MTEIEAAIGILTIEMADEMLARIEKRRSNPIMRGPPGTVTDLIVPIEIMHELLMLWKFARLIGTPRT